MSDDKGMQRRTSPILKHACSPLFESLESRALFSDTPLSGASFGTAGSWRDLGNTYDKAFDQNPATYVDTAVADNAFVGQDLGSARSISAVRFYPRQDLAWRMVGGQFQGSNDNSSWTTFAKLTNEPTEKAYTTLTLSQSVTYRYVRYLSPAGGYDNIAELEFLGPAESTTATGPTKLTGVATGTAGSYANSSSTFDKAFDGSPSTFFDSPTPDSATVSLDLGSAKPITSVRYAPRPWYADRMVGGQFQGSNDNATWTTLATVTTRPADGVYTGFPVVDITPYRYVRYLSPAGGYGNVAEVEFYGGGTTASDGSTALPNISAPTTPAAPSALTITATSTSSVSLAWADNATTETGYIVARATGTSGWRVLATLPAGSTSYTDTTVTSDTTYTYRVVSTAAAGYSASVTAVVTTPSPLPPGPSPTAPAPVITLLESSVTAGMAIHANAVTSTVLNSGTPLTSRYDWDFGNPAGKYNTLTGFNAAHVYDTPGAYTIRLKVTNDAGKSTTVTSSVTILSDTRKTIYVDSLAGSDTNGGTSIATPVQSVARAFQLAGNNTKVLFARGQTHAVTASIGLTYTNMTIGAYGTGDKPVLQWQGSTESWWEMLSVGSQAKDLMVQDLVLDSASGLPNGIAPRGTNVSLRNLEIRRFSTAINCAGNPTGLLVQDCTQPVAGTVTAYFLWLQGDDSVILGNSVADGGMYAIRSSGINGYTNRSLIAFNELDHVTGSSNLRLQKGTYYYVANNTIRGKGIDFGPNGGGLGFDDPDYKTVRTTWVVMENNTAWFQTGLSENDIKISHRAQHVVIRNNVIHRDDEAAAIHINGYRADYDAQSYDIYIQNNTVLNNGRYGMFLRMDEPELTPEVTLTGNLYVAPNQITGANASEILDINDPLLTSFKYIGGNIWDSTLTDGYAAGGVIYVQPLLGGTGFVTPAQWLLLPVVHNDLFADPVLAGTYQFTLNGVTAGANLVLN